MILRMDYTTALVTEEAMVDNLRAVRAVAETATSEVNLYLISTACLRALNFIQMIGMTMIIPSNLYLMMKAISA